MTFLERIKAGVFRNALKKNDNVLVLLNHDNNRVLASTKDGNAVLEEDNIGLRAEITITDKEVVQKARDGKLSGWSFGFIANDDELTTEGKDEIRTVTDLDLLEVSILDDTKAPAYYGTSIEAREGGAKVVEIRADAFTQEQTAEPNAEQTEQPTISIDELAELVAAKVIEALKTEEKADETEAETQEETETEEQTEDTAETEETEEADTEEQTEETTEEQAQDADAEEEAEETEEQESRSIDYSTYEARLAKLMK
jgi:HK97 family phage prohead protease